MEKTFTMTKEEIQETFRIWNKDYLANPDDFAEIGSNSSHKQANSFIAYLQKVQKK